MLSTPAGDPEPAAPGAGENVCGAVALGARDMLRVRWNGVEGDEQVAEIRVGGCGSALVLVPRGDGYTHNPARGERGDGN